MHNSGRRVCFWIDSKDKRTRKRVCIPLPPLIEWPWPQRGSGSHPASPGDPSPWRPFALDGAAARSIEQLAGLALIAGCPNGNTNGNGNNNYRQ